MKDEAIVELYWQRSEDAIRETSRKYEAYLSAIAYNVLFDAEDCRECVNDTYLAAWNSMPENRPRVLSAYLGKIVRQIAIDCFRKKNSLKRHASEYALSLDEMENDLADARTPDRELQAKELDAAINSFVRNLPPKTRNVFIGRYYFFDPVKTVADYCGMSEAQVKTLLHRTRLKLKDYLVKEGFLE